MLESIRSLASDYGTVQYLRAMTRPIALHGLRPMDGDWHNRSRLLCEGHSLFFCVELISRGKESTPSSPSFYV